MKKINWPYVLLRLVELVGFLLIVTGIWMVYAPAALIVGGATLLALVNLKEESK